MNISKIIRLWDLYPHRWYYYCSKKDIQHAFVYWPFWFWAMERHSKKILLDIDILTLGLETIRFCLFEITHYAVLCFSSTKWIKACALLQSKPFFYLHKPPLLGKCSYQPLSKPLFTANGDHHKKSQPDTIQKSTDRGEPSPSGYIYFIAPLCMSWGNIGEEWKEGF